MLFCKQSYNYSSRRSGASRIVLIFGIIALFFAYEAVVQVRQYFFRTSTAATVEFVVHEGESMKSVAGRLADEDIIPSAWWFRVTAKFAGLDDRIRAGTTFVIPGDRSADVLGALVYPSGASEVSVTIPEGYTLVQIGEAVRVQLPEITLQDWNRVTGVSSPFVTDAFVVAAQKPADVDLEGYLFPDTYRFFKNASAEDVVERMLRTMESRVRALGTPSDDAQGMTIHELLTLASIIEREVRRPEDMLQVSDIFLKRLAIGMALQSDATVNYVIHGDNPAPSLDDIAVDSLYNTYKHPGLPPGAISNPGLSALTAVWHPASNDFYYFLTDISGNIYYAATHDVHVQNKVKYL